LLTNRYPAEYRQRVVQEVSGPSGAAIPVALSTDENPFNVKIVLSGDPNPVFKFVDHLSAKTIGTGQW
jgi:hypothetical protein